MNKTAITNDVSPILYITGCTEDGTQYRLYASREEEDMVNKLKSFFYADIDCTDEHVKHVESYRAIVAERATNGFIWPYYDFKRSELDDFYGAFGSLYEKGEGDPIPVEKVYSLIDEEATEAERMKRDYAETVAECKRKIANGVMNADIIERLIERPIASL